MPEPESTRNCPDCDCRGPIHGHVCGPPPCSHDSCPTCGCPRRSPPQDVPAEQQASGEGFAAFLKGMQGAAAASQPFHVRFAVDVECTHPRELYAALRDLAARILKDVMEDV